MRRHITKKETQMKNALKWDCLFRGVNGFLWVGAGFLTVSLALSTKVWLMGGHAQLGEVIFWVFLAAWGKALAMGVVGFLPVLIFVRASRICQERKSSYLIGGSRENFRTTRSLPGERAYAGGVRHL
jgi:hypothetical protein